MISFLCRPLLISFCAATMLVQGSCMRDSYEVKLSGPIELTDQWTLLQPTPSLKTDKDSEKVVIELDSPYKNDFYKEGKGPSAGNGILMPDGEVTNPEIEVIDQYGNVFKLVYAGARRTFWPAYDLPYPNEWPRDREYKAVRIRSPRRIKCKAIYWFSESSKDLK
jgi:hypothetical protein